MTADPARWDHDPTVDRKEVMSNYQPTPPPAPYSGGGLPASERTNTLSIVALVLGIVIPIGGIICGHIALSQIKKTGEKGHGLALAGTIIGYAFTILGILGIIAYIALFATLISSGAMNGASLSP